MPEVNLKSVAILSKQGKLHVPKIVRDQLEVTEGDGLAFVPTDDGKFKLYKIYPQLVE